ncbi:DUF86 domain-containing protein [Candidatus Woesearchaeota archaeon]|nr:DUF86 domain-containing protein [Candidatus Woesearchaeota archaeon]
MNKKRITSLLDFLDQYNQELEEHLPESYQEYVSQQKRYCERLLQLLIEVCIDVCQAIIRELKLGLPSDEDNMFKTLYEKKIISEEMALKLKNMKAFRNVLIHHYTKIEDQRVYDNIMENRKDFLEFKNEIKEYLKTLKK